MIGLDDLVGALPGSRTVGHVPATFTGWAFDSRITRPGEIFVAVQTDRANGHDHVEAARAAGATAALVSHEVDDGPSVVVSDPMAAVTAWAGATVARLAPTVVGIGGSVGKSTTKELTALVLDSAQRVFRSPANFGGEFGLPIGLGTLESDHEVAVLELASGHRGEIAAMTAVAAPDIVVLAPITPVYTATFGDEDAIAEEYGQMVKGLAPDGLAIMTGDDERLARVAQACPSPVVTVGTGSGADIRADNIEVGRASTGFDVIGLDDEVHRLELPLIGRHQVTAALAALAVGRHMGVRAAAALAALEGAEPLPGRLHPHRLGSGGLLLDDSFSSSPAALDAALVTLDEVAAGRTRVAVLGDMDQLGADTAAFHRAAAPRVARSVDVLVTVGEHMADLAAHARGHRLGADAIHVTWSTADALDAVESVIDQVGSETAVLVKGSAPARLERVSAALVGDPVRVATSVPRQDEAWRRLAVVDADRPTWLEIDHTAIAANVARLTEVADGAQLTAVLKADGYGHGAIGAAHTARLHGATRFAVACLSEAQELRAAGIEEPIIVLGWTPGWSARAALRAAVTLTVFDLDTARAYSAAARATGVTARVHVKVDTGMHRLGIAPDDAVGFLRTVGGLPGVEVEGLFTHFATADESPIEVEVQLDRFRLVVAEVTQAGLRPPLCHSANSAALLGIPESRFDMVRPGLAVYGLSPFPDRSAGELGLTPALRWKSLVAQVRTISEGEGVGYGLTWRADRPTRLATVPVGYADGFRRAPTGWRHVLVAGSPAPVVGRVSMDQITIDVTDVCAPNGRPVHQGDEVVLIGRQGDAVVTAEDVAGWLGTINYEVVAQILARVPRVSP